MKALQAIKKYMVPFLKEFGFVITKTHLGMIVFQHEENPDLRIFFEIQKGRGISPTIRRDNSGHLSAYRLSLFLDEPSEMDCVCRDEYWNFDTDDELIGALEEQANLLKNRAFDWLFRRTDLDIYAILKKNAIDRKNAYDSADESGKDRAEYNEWQARRVKPVNWK
jgi:hypothetical protein